MNPEHTTTAPEELRRRLWAIRMRELNPKDQMGFIINEAVRRADDAMREVFESVFLPDELQMYPEEFETMCATLGAYNDTLPSGTRVGKRWCRRGTATRPNYVCEYVELDPPVPNKVGIKWRRVTLIIEVA